MFEEYRITEAQYMFYMYVPIHWTSDYGTSDFKSHTAQNIAIKKRFVHNHRGGKGME